MARSRNTWNSFEHHQCNSNMEYVISNGNYHFNMMLFFVLGWHIPFQIKLVFMFHDFPKFSIKGVPQHLKSTAGGVGLGLGSYGACRKHCQPGDVEPSLKVHTNKSNLKHDLSLYIERARERTYMIRRLVLSMHGVDLLFASIRAIVWIATEQPFSRVPRARNT